MQVRVLPGSTFLGVPGIAVLCARVLWCHMALHRVYLHRDAPHPDTSRSDMTRITRGVLAQMFLGARAHHHHPATPTCAQPHLNFPPHPTLHPLQPATIDTHTQFLARGGNLYSVIFKTTPARRAEPSRARPVPTEPSRARAEPSRAEPRQVKLRAKLPLLL